MSGAASETQREALRLVVELVRGTRTLAEITGMTSKDAAELARRGEALADDGNLESARVIFEGLVACNPRDVGAQAALGTLYEKLGRRQLAMDCFDAALALDPHHPVARLGRGELRLRIGDRLGLEDLHVAASSDPTGRSVAGRRAAALLEVLRKVQSGELR